MFLYRAVRLYRHWTIFIVSGKRDSNPQPSPWQGDILPIELLPHWGEQELNLVHLFLSFNSKKGADDESRTHVSTLAMSCNNRYTTPAY